MINFEQFTIDNGAIRDLNELLFTSVYNDPDLERVINIRTGVKNGKKLGYIDTMGEVGVKAAGCDPNYSKVNITGIEKTWNLGEWEVPKEICYKELENTLAELGFNAGTERADLTNTPYWDKVLVPLLQKALKEMLWRFAWFGDKNAKHIADGGNVSDALDLNLFNAETGLFARLKALVAANPSQQTTIAANAETTYDKQKSELYKSGVAIGIVESLLSDADSRIFDADDHTIMMTRSLFMALRKDMAEKFGKTTLTYEQVAKGLGLSSFDGNPILVVDIWDRMLRKYENNGTAIVAPHRAVFTSPSNLFVGTSDTDLLSSLSVKFNDVDRKNYIYTASDFGTLIGEDDLVQFAI